EKGLRNGVHDAARQGFDFFSGITALDQQGKLIPIEARQHVPIRYMPIDALRDLAQDIITCAMPQGLVKILKSVDINIAQHQTTLTARAARRGNPEPVAKKHSIGQSRYRVEIG